MVNDKKEKEEEKAKGFFFFNSFAPLTTPSP